MCVDVNDASLHTPAPCSALPMAHAQHNSSQDTNHMHTQRMSCQHCMSIGSTRTNRRGGGVCIDVHDVFLAHTSTLQRSPHGPLRPSTVRMRMGDVVAVA